jgi:hypothetical protein
LRRTRSDNEGFLLALGEGRPSSGVGGFDAADDFFLLLNHCLTPGRVMGSLDDVEPFDCDGEIGEGILK